MALILAENQMLASLSEAEHEAAWEEIHQELRSSIRRREYLRALQPGQNNLFNDNSNALFRANAQVCRNLPQRAPFRHFRVQELDSEQSHTLAPCSALGSPAMGTTRPSFRRQRRGQVFACRLPCGTSTETGGVVVI